MKTSIRIFSLFFLSLFVFQQSQAQSCGDCIGFVNATASTTLICAGQAVTIFAEGDGYAYANNFNTQTLGTGWTTNLTPMFNNPCGPGLDGSPHLWMGSSTAAPRLLETVDFNMSGGGNVSFDLCMAIQGNASPCEGPDLATEGVYIDFSTDGGATWTNIFYFLPPNAGGPAAYNSWANYSFPLPPEAQTPCTRFRWYQGGSSGNAYDHWGLDNIQIGPALPPGSVLLFWENNLQNALPSEVIYPQSDTMLVLVMQTPIDTCRDTIFITVSEPPVPLLTFQPNPVCAGLPVNFIASGSSGTIGQVNYDLDNNGTYDYFINAPGDTVFSILIPGVYTIKMQIVAPGGCEASDFFNLTVNPRPTLDLTASPLSVCLGDAIFLRDSTSLINPPSLNTNIDFFTWDFENDLIIDSVSPGSSITGPPIIRKESVISHIYQTPGTYEILSSVVTTGGCVAFDSITVVVHDLPRAGYTTANVCDGTNVEFTDTTQITAPEIISDYAWSFASSSPVYAGSSDVQNPSMLFPGYGTYSVQLITTSNFGCVDTAEGFVTVHKNPKSDFIFVTQCFQTNILQQTATPPTGLTYQWDLDNDGTPDESLPGFTYVFPDSSDQLVTLTVIDTNNCVADTTILVDVKGGVDNPIMPNVLSISSSINNRFDFTVFAPGFNECIDYTLYIYNRWGYKVYEAINNTSNPDMSCNQCFTGKNASGGALIPGTYFYVLKGSTDIELKGTVTVFD
ncbi:MAG: gliding motility-associated C-terminal domain-containing protein [Candidatus Competibacteraceae bacterium]|nr:gliding motility-associated C-terminal domain-containing protein [Candidatus Competibacteraceae bacterium]